MLCALILYISSGAYSLPSIFYKPFYDNFIYCQSFWKKSAESKLLRKNLSNFVWFVLRLYNFIKMYFIRLYLIRLLKNVYLSVMTSAVSRLRIDPLYWLGYITDCNTEILVGYRGRLTEHFLIRYVWRNEPIFLFDCIVQLIVMYMSCITFKFFSADFTLSALVSAITGGTYSLKLDPKDGFEKIFNDNSYSFKVFIRRQLKIY